MQQRQPPSALANSEFLAAPIENQLAASKYTTALLQRELEVVRHARRSELAEKESLADRLQSLLNALPAAVLVLDRHGKVQEFNPAAQRLLGGDLKERLWRELTALIFIPQALPSDDLLLRNGSYVSLSTCPLGHEPGQILMLQDVTEKRQLQQHLDHSRRLADMGRMGASLAHQIRTPLSSALLYVSQLNALKSNSDIQQRFSGKALQSLKGLEKLIADMLLFANGGNNERQRVSAQQLLIQALEPLQEKLAAQGIELECEIALGEPKMDVNASMVISALQNLITNAIQAMPRGGLLTLSLLCKSDALQFVVGDSGPGISQSLQARLFEPFVTSREGGTGLGLAVVQAVAHSMGGSVTCDSVEGEGSRFTLQLPRVKDRIKPQPEFNS